MMIGYIDPGSGSLILQLLAGGMIGLMFLIKSYWQRCKQLCSRMWQALGAHGKH